MISSEFNDHDYIATLLMAQYSYHAYTIKYYYNTPVQWEPGIKYDTTSKMITAPHGI